MEAILTIFILAILNGVIVFLDEMITGIIPLTLYAEQYMTNVGGTSLFKNMYDVFFEVGVSLIILKFVKKGFEIYVMWTSGDADDEPIVFLINFMRAIIVAITFPIIYEYIADITIDLADLLITEIGQSTNMDWNMLFTTIGTMGIVPTILGLIFVIMYFILYFQFLMRGLEMLLVRVALPIACVGLVDNDKGIFKSYSSQFIKLIVTVIVQIILMKLGIALMMGLHFLWGIGCLGLAVKTPKILSEYILPMEQTGGSNALNNAYHSAKIFKMAKNVFVK